MLAAQKGESTMAPTYAIQRLLLPLLGASLFACGAPADEHRPPEPSRIAVAPSHDGSEGPVAPMVRKDWIGHAMGLSGGQWAYIGDMKMADPAEQSAVQRLDPAAISVPNLHPSRLVVGDPKTRRLYQVDPPSKDWSILAAALGARGYAQPDFGPLGPAESTDEVSALLTNGTDNRINRGIDNYGLNAWPLRTIGQLKNNGTAEAADGHCTAAFVGNAGPNGSRYIVSAAHCYWNLNTGAYRDPDFWPRQDKCRTQEGAVVSGCDQGPYGEWDGGVWTMYSYFVDNCIGPLAPAECIANDIVIQQVWPVGNATFPGSLGYAAADTTMLNGLNKYHRGYPNCNDANDPHPASPNVCVSRTLYGDGAMPDLGPESMPDADDWNRRFKFGSDTSNGHSGGPLYYTDSGSQFIFGVVSAEPVCIGSNCGATPNFARRITPEWFDVMVAVMSM